MIGGGPVSFPRGVGAIALKSLAIGPPRHRSRHVWETTARCHWSFSLYAVDWDCTPLKDRPVPHQKSYQNIVGQIVFLARSTALLSALC